MTLLAQSLLSLVLERMTRSSLWELIICLKTLLKSAPTAPLTFQLIMFIGLKKEKGLMASCGGD